MLCNLHLAECTPHLHHLLAGLYPRDLPLCFMLYKAEICHSDWPRSYLFSVYVPRDPGDQEAYDLS